MNLLLSLKKDATVQQELSDSDGVTPDHGKTPHTEFSRDCSGLSTSLSGISGPRMLIPLRRLWLGARAFFVSFLFFFFVRI
jgi:hypothetical protein